MTEEIILPAKLDISAAATLHADLLAREAQDVTLDLGKVTHLGALCLQLMIAAARRANEAGKTFALYNMNDRVITQMRLLGTSPETIMEGQP